MNFEESFINYIKAGASIIQIVSYETQRIHGIVNRASDELNREWYSWNRIEGLKKWNKNERKFEDSDDSSQEVGFLFDTIEENEENAIFILEDFHPDLDENQVRTIRRLRNFAVKNAPNKTIVISQPFHLLPRELQKEVVVLELPFPPKEDLKVMFEHVCNQHGVSSDIVEESDKILDAALGLTIMEARLAFSKVIVRHGRITDYEIPDIISEKESIIKKSGFLEYYHPNEDLSDVGGLEVLKNWLSKRGKAFGKGAEDYGLDTPRGVLLLGIPGTGKSLSAKAIANSWRFPLLRLDMGKVFGGIVGESERNIRGALSVAEAIAPCVLWIDEIEKGLSGGQSSGSTDGGTTSRVLGTFLTWMQEKKKPVFVVATANDVSVLPPELLRKGRVDEIFFVDLPASKAREEIIKIHLQRKKREPENFDLDSLAKMSRGFSGAELEEALKEAMFTAFDEGEELTTEHFQKAIKKTYPLSKTMGETISSLRSWARARAVYAAIEEAEDIPKDSQEDEKKVPKLKQEMNNPFL